VRYAPGLKIEDASTAPSKGKWWSQFRDPYGQAPALYQSARTADLATREGALAAAVVAGTLGGQNVRNPSQSPCP